MRWPGLGGAVVCALFIDEGLGAGAWAFDRSVSSKVFRVGDAQAGSLPRLAGIRHLRVIGQALNERRCSSGKVDEDGIVAPWLLPWTRCTSAAALGGIPLA